MSNYKTDDLKIDSRAARKEVNPSQVLIPKIDTRVKSLMMSNAHELPVQKSYTGEVPDVNFTSNQYRKSKLKELQEKTERIKEQFKSDPTMIPTERNNPDAY